MQLPHLKTNDYPAIRSCTGQSGCGFELERCERVVEQVDQPGARGPELDDDGGNGRHVRGEIESALGNLELTVEIDPGDCVSHISRGNARYHRSDSECETDYQAAFFLDAVLAARETVRRLEADIRDDVCHVLVNCRERLRIDNRNTVARIRLGLALLLLYQDEKVLHDLQQVVRQSPVWRPYLRLLVKEAKRRRDPAA